MEIIPSILVKTKEELMSKIKVVESYVERVHLDIADGIFVPNTTIIGFKEVEEIESGIMMDVHLMVSKPENHVVRWLETNVDGIIFHIEATAKTQEVIDLIKESDRVVGIALNPQTPIEKIESHVNQIDFVHFMTVEPGFYGGKFLDLVIQKIKDFHYLYPDKKIQVDGGVNLDNIDALSEAGVSMFVVGSYLYNSQDVGKAIEELKKVDHNS